MKTIIKPAATIRQNYNAISSLCKETGTPVFLTKNGQGDLVVMDIETFNRREEQLNLRERLLEQEERRHAGFRDIPANDADLRLRNLLDGEKDDVSVFTELL